MIKTIRDEDIIMAANNSISAAEAARKLGIGFSTYTRKAEKLGVYKTNQGLKGCTKTRARAYTVNDTAFNELSYEAAYFLGYIAADGSIVNNRLKFMIQSQDEDILRELLRFMQSNYPIGRCKSHYTDENGIVHYFDASYIAITSSKVIESLSKYGIIQGKKYKDIDFLLNIPDKYKLDFIIGLFDGDGGIYIDSKAKQFAIHIALNRATSKSVQYIFNNLGIETNVREDKSVDVLFIRNARSKQIFTRYYIESGTRHYLLKRKLDKFYNYIAATQL